MDKLKMIGGTPLQGEVLIAGAKMQPCQFCAHAF
jgi:hypothetical protein